MLKPFIYSYFLNYTSNIPNKKNDIIIDYYYNRYTVK